MRHSLLNCVTRAELRLLQGPHKVAGGKFFAYAVAPVAVHHTYAGRVDGGSGIDNMGEQGFAGERLQDLGQPRSHAGALTGGEYHDASFHDVSLPPQKTKGQARNPFAMACSRLRRHKG